MLRILYNDFDQNVKNIHDEMDLHHSYKKSVYCIVSWMLIQQNFTPPVLHFSVFLPAGDKSKKKREAVANCASKIPMKKKQTRWLMVFDKKSFCGVLAWLTKFICLYLMLMGN